jgi:hypothetical protein
MKRPRLPQVTLCAVDARSPQLALEALQRSMQQVDFARVLLFSHGFSTADPTIETIDVGPIRSGAEYSAFVLTRMPAYIHTSHVLVTQWDGFVLDGAAWRDDFLRHDYVGAVWDDQPRALSVGNGGFSLRSQRLLKAGTDPRIEQSHPEDVALCRTYRSLMEHEHGVSFAPPEVAARFAYENLAPAGPTFGFHGPKNLATVLDAATLRRWTQMLPDGFYGGRDARRLMRALLLGGMGDLAAEVASRRLALGRGDASTRLVAWLAPAIHSALHPFGKAR